MTKRKAHRLAVFGSVALTAALIAPAVGFAAGLSFPTTDNATVTQAMEHVASKTRLALNAPTAIPQWQEGYLSASTVATANSYRVNLWDTRMPLPLNSPRIATEKTFAGGVSFGAVQLGAPLPPASSPGYLTPLINHNPMWVVKSGKPAGSVTLGDAIDADRYRVDGKILLVWHEGDWAIEVLGNSRASAIRAAEPIVSLLHAAYLPPYPGIYAVNPTAAHQQPTTTIDWIRGKTLSWVQDRHPSTQNAVASGRMAMSWNRVATTKTGSSNDSHPSLLVLGNLSLTLPAGWLRPSTTAPQAGTQTVKASSSAGATLTITRQAPSGPHAQQLLPGLPKPPGLTANTFNRSPYFAETRTTADGVVQFQLWDLTASGHQYYLNLEAPEPDAAAANQIMASLRIPAPATVADAVHLLLAHSAPKSGVPMARAQVGPDNTDAWLLAGGSPATAQEGWFLFHTVDGGKDWRLEADTTWSAPFKIFPNSVGMPSMRFWNENQGLIAMPSYAASRLIIYRTDDGGATWQSTTIACSSQPNIGKAPTITRSANGRLTITATLYSGQVVHFSSVNGGATWTAS
jgi:hypothetical protein